MVVGIYFRMNIKQELQEINELNTVLQHKISALNNYYADKLADDYQEKESKKETVDKPKKRKSTNKVVKRTRNSK